ncbi:hypothetical protein [Paraburkholderia sp. 40]|uniref:hypothetical protein n=1 Tax=Paraburkholderia sp. 40 TaxID=2991059 RepID=UPI003D1FC82A
MLVGKPPNKLWQVVMNHANLLGGTGEYADVQRWLVADTRLSADIYSLISIGRNNIEHRFLRGRN